MISILKNNIVALAVLGVFLLVPSVSSAQTSQTISVSPTLFEIKAAQEQVWQSELRVINVNDYDLVVYPQVVNFAPLGETGRGSLLPIVTEETQGQTLAEWVDITTDPVTIPRQQTVAIPFTIRAPKDAAPGGHYAAIMVGTKPPTDTVSGSQFITAQFVTSLLFVRMAGEVVEDGLIREFRAIDSVVQRPDTTFEVRFENKGTVHLQPRGDIQIYNMWGAERGSIPINHQTNFGNVLPNSIRQFQFAWRSDVSLYDMGRYRAVATLAYGEDEQFFTHSTAYFWVIPFKQVALVLLVLGTSIGLLVMLVRMYVRRMLSLAGIDASPVQRGRSVSHTSHELPLRKGRAVKTVIVSQYEQATAPVRFEFAAVIKMLQGRAPRQYGALIARYVWEKRVIALACIGVLLGVGLIAGFIVVVSSAVRSYEVTIFTGGSEIVLSDEELRYNELRQSTPLAEELLSSTTVKVVNVSGVVGLGAEARIFLEDKKIPVTALSSEGDRKERKNVVVFHPDAQETALEISKLLDGALLSANAAQESGSVTVLVGYEFTRQ